MRHARSLLLGLAAALALATAARLPAAWESGNALNHVSGAWMTLAQDLADGTFYRPLHDPALGYGGTRFFPLAFALHAGLVRAGLPLLPAGYALSLAAVALVVVGAFALLRRIGVPRAPSLAFAALALAGFAVQLGASAVRGDLLPVGLSALGLAAVASRPPRGRLALAALLFALAFAAKPTSLTAPAAAVAWLAVRRERGRAAVLALATAGLAAGAVLAADAASSGRFLGLLRACASGGAGVRDALVAPWKLLRYFTVGDPSGLVLVAGAGATMAAALRDRLRAERRRAAADSPLLLPALWLGAAGAGLLGVLASPGTGVNHLVEVEVAAAAALGATWLAPGAAARVARLAGPAAAAAGVVVAVATFREDVASSRLLEARAVARALPPGALLSEDPLVPIAAGARPVLLDPWMLRLAGERDPALVRGLAREIAAGSYASIVLLRDLDDPEADAWFAQGNLGRDVAEEIRRTCRRAGGVGRYHVYVPRGAPGAPEHAAPGRQARGRPTPAGQPERAAEDADPRVVAGTPPR
jgi:hypothetical protein